MRTVDLFSGCGGMSLGFQNAGFDICCAYDNWDPAVETYQHNFNHPVRKMDLYDNSAVQSIKSFNPDIIIGGPPCQDFSIAGKRDCGKRANLTIRYSEIVSLLRPTWFVMENVYNIEKNPILSIAKQNFIKAGYGLTSKVLNASYCGVPQARKRFFLIGKLGEKDDFLEDIITSNLSKKQTTLYDYLGNKLNTEYYYMHPRNYKRRAVFSIYESSATIRGVNRPIPADYKKHNGDKADINQGVRILTSKERSYIQTFPEWFEFCGNKTNVEQQIGNAVPVKLAEYVANCILKYEKTV